MMVMPRYFVAAKAPTRLRCELCGAAIPRGADIGQRTNKGKVHVYCMYCAAAYTRP